MADITVTIPNSTFTVDTISNGIEVTTPTSVEVNVDSNSNTIDITNTPQEITVLTGGTIIQQSGVTSVNGNTGPAVVLDTDDINEGTTNKYFANALARQAISATDTGGDGSLSYDNSTGVITYTGPSASEVRAHFTGGTGVTITTGTIAIGQSVATTDSVTFGSVNLDSRAILDTLTLTTSATTADQVLDSFSASAYRTAKYLISVTSGTDYHSIEMLVNHNGTTANQTTYADLPTTASLASFSVDISGGNVRLLTTPANAVTVYNVTRTAIVV